MSNLLWGNRADQNDLVVQPKELVLSRLTRQMESSCKPLEKSPDGVVNDAEDVQNDDSCYNPFDDFSEPRGAVGKHDVQKKNVNTDFENSPKQSAYCHQ